MHNPTSGTQQDQNRHGRVWRTVRRGLRVLCIFQQTLIGLFMISFLPLSWWFRMERRCSRKRSCSWRLFLQCTGHERFGEHRRSIPNHLQLIKPSPVSTLHSLGTHSQQAWLRKKNTWGTSIDAMNKISYCLTYHSFLFYISKLLYVTIISYFLPAFIFF